MMTNNPIMPSREELKPLLKKARKCSGYKHARETAVALYDQDGNLISGPEIISGPSRIEWGRSGIEVGGGGPFTSYEDLKESWKRTTRKQRLTERKNDDL